MLTSLAADAEGATATERSQDGVKHQVQFLAYVLRKKAKDDVVVFLKELVFASIPTVGHWVREMLGSVQLDRDARIGAQKIDLQTALAVERNRESDVQAESPFGFG